VSSCTDLAVQIEERLLELFDLFLSFCTAFSFSSSAKGKENVRKRISFPTVKTA
jgi:hypothetical protein